MPYAKHSIEARLLANDPEAVGQVIRWIAAVLTSPRLWALRDEWIDLHQEILMRLVESLKQERYDASREFRLYVQGIARFTALQALEERRRRHAFTLEPGLADPAAGDSENRMVSLQMAQKVLDLVPDECRRLMQAYFIESRDYAEIATSLNTPIGTVKSRLFRCLEAACRLIGSRRMSHRAQGRRPRSDRSPEAES